MISLFEISQSEINEIIVFVINSNLIKGKLRQDKLRKGIFERAYLNWHYRKGILMKDISERAFPKGHFRKGILMKGIKRKVILREGHFRRAKGQRA